MSKTDDALYSQAVDIVVTSQRVSVSAIQRQLRIGFSQACGYIDEMQTLGIVSAPDAVGRRAVLIADPVGSAPVSAQGHATGPMSPAQKQPTPPPETPGGRVAAVVGRTLKDKWLALADQQLQWARECDAKGDGANSHTCRGRARIYRECADDLDALLAVQAERDRQHQQEIDRLKRGQATLLRAVESAEAELAAVRAEAVGERERPTQTKEGTAP